MRAPVVMLLGLGLAAAGGCRNCDLVEAELRSRESQVRELQDQVYRAESHNNALEHELRDLRQH
ncbi:MAG: hypothetical protein JO112_16210 [Planctomycetes bacterium]|nr:hypothetical protein [Planctomycetota bacterium]